MLPTRSRRDGLDALAREVDAEIGQLFRTFGSVHRQRSIARELLGPEHPLLAVIDHMRTRRTQTGVVTALVAGSAAGALAGVSAARPVLAAAALVQVALACSLALVSAGRRDRALDLIIEGRPDLPLAPVARERARLLDPRRRVELSRSLDALRHEALHPRLRRPSERPLYVRHVVAAVAVDIAETADRLRSPDAAVPGVAMAERLLTRHDSPLYGDSAEALRVDLRRCRFLCSPPALPHRSPVAHGTSGPEDFRPRERSERYGRRNAWRSVKRGPVMSGTVDQTGRGGLRRRLNGSVLLPGQDGYEEARAVFNAMIDTRPALIAPSTDVEDVSARAQADRVALSSASRAALSGPIGRNVSIARFAAVTSSGAPSVAMTVNSSTSPRGVCSLSETTGYPGGSHDYRNASNRLFFSDTRTRWARFWADWPTLAPAAGQLDATRLAALDAQIARAKRDGLRIMLTLYRFPTWANATDVLTAQALASTMADRKTATDPDSKAKSLLMRYPDDVSEGAAFGRFLTTLVSRYSRNNTRRPVPDAVVDFIELGNEPNYTWWPQQAPSTDPANPYATSTITIADVVARMFVTAQRITARYGGEPMLCGPGVSDTTDGGRLRTAYHGFTERLLPALTAVGFVPGARFAWSHHNYTDVTYDMGPGSTYPGAATDPTRLTNRAADVRRRLVGRWAGWPAGDSANPQILLTEGGVTLPNIAARWGITDPAAQRAKQAELVQRNWNRMAVNTGDGAGIAMLAYYLWYTDPNYDCGLAETFESGGATRPAYRTWKALPSFQ